MSLPSAFRPFGGAAVDLEVDFSAPRPHLVTALLHACAAPPLSPAECGALTAGERTAALLRIAAADGTDLFVAEVVCVGCGVRVEVDLPVAGLLVFHAAAAPPAWVTVAVGGGTVTLRRATGADQAAWWAGGYPNEEAALRAVLETLRVDGEDGDDWPEGADLARMDEAMAEADPLVAFRTRIACPECGLEQSIAVDLQELALGVLARAQHALIEDVHRIVRAYHWTEDRVMALPAWRRARYLALVERKEGV